MFSVCGNLGINYNEIKKKDMENIYKKIKD